MDDSRKEREKADAKDLYKRAQKAVLENDRAQKAVADQRIDKILQEHLQRVLDRLYKSHDSGLYLLSENVLSNDGISDSLKKYISNLHIRIASVIEGVAVNIENKHYEDVARVANDKNLTLRQRQSGASLVAAQKQVSISLRTLQITTTTFRNYNQTMLNRLASNRDKTAERKLVLWNAILVYELTSYVINYIEDFQVNGIREIFELYQGSKRRLDDFETKLSKLEAQALSSGPSETQVQVVRADIAGKREGLKVLREEWDNYLGDIVQVAESKKAVYAKLPTLKLIKANAANHIEFIELVMELAIVKSYLESFNAAIVDIEDLELAPMSGDKVRRLIGTEDIGG